MILLPCSRHQVYSSPGMDVEPGRRRRYGAEMKGLLIEYESLSAKASRNVKVVNFPDLAFAKPVTNYSLGGKTRSPHHTGKQGFLAPKFKKK